MVAARPARPGSAKDQKLPAEPALRLEGERVRVLGVIEEHQPALTPPQVGVEEPTNAAGGYRQLNVGRRLPRYHGWGLTRSTVHRAKETPMAYQFA